MRYGALGDLVLTFPTLEALARGPGWQVWMVTAAPYRDLVSLHPAVDHVVAAPRAGLADQWRLASTLRAVGFDWTLDLQGTPRTRWLSARLGAPQQSRVDGARWRRRRLVAAAHWRRQRRVPANPLPAVEPVWRRAARLVEPEPRPPRVPALRVPAPPSPAAAELERLPSPRIGLAPGAKHRTKRWPFAGWLELAAELSTRGYGVVWLAPAGDPRPPVDWPRPAGVSVLGGQLVELAAILGTLDVVCANDSGLGHLAAAVGTPVVSVFGATVPELGFEALGHQTIVEEEGLGCRPCSVHGGARCFRGDLACLTSVRPRALLAAVEAQLQAGGAPKEREVAP